ncbi:MAG: M3 family oligoendopeptidase, partial [Lewinella sp.]|nr:M3 family oligoendopeptidase [Lewinella sp.]
MPLLQEENRLSSAYVELKAQAKIELDGTTYNLSNILTQETSPNPQRRQQAVAAKWAWYEANQSELDRIFDELVACRTTMAHRLGFDNFIELGYARMLRTDYDAAQVSRFRDA